MDKQDYIMKCIFYPFVHYRIPPNQLAVYPNWLTAYFLQIAVPMLGMVSIAFKIMLKNGKDLRREFLSAHMPAQTKSVLVRTISSKMLPSSTK